MFKGTYVHKPTANHDFYTPLLNFVCGDQLMQLQMLKWCVTKAYVL